MAYILLLLSIISEVFGTTMLKLSTGFKSILPAIGVIIGYGISFYLLSLVLLELPLGFTYAVWGGVGTVVTAMAGVILFKEKLNKKSVLGIFFIMIGVILLNVE